MGVRIDEAGKKRRVAELVGNVTRTRFRIRTYRGNPPALHGDQRIRHRVAVSVNQTRCVNRDWCRRRRADRRILRERCRRRRSEHDDSENNRTTRKRTRE
jgi:hypothetical protein